MGKERFEQSAPQSHKNTIYLLVSVPLLFALIILLEMTLGANKKGRNDSAGGVVKVSRRERTNNTKR